jgi:N-methylhydantoinase A
VFQIGIDIGGTFTDCVLIGDPAADGTAAYRTAKALSTKGDPADGVLAGLTDLADSMGLALPGCSPGRGGSGMARRSARTPSWSAPGPVSA